MSNATKLELGEVKSLAAIVARVVRTTPGLQALNAWSAALHGLLGAAYVAEVDRTWPVVRWDLQAAEQDRRVLQPVLWWYGGSEPTWQCTTAPAVEEEATRLRRMGYAVRIQSQTPTGKPTDADMALVRQAGG